MIREPEQGRNRAASMVVDQPVGNDRTSSEIRRVKGKQKIGEIGAPEEFPRGNLGPKQTTYFKKSKKKSSEKFKGHMASQSFSYSR